MNYEKIGYSFIGSLIAGSIIQNNMGMGQQYFFIISVGLWAVCIGVQWWNCKREEKVRDKFENLKLETRDAIVKSIIETISTASEKEIACIKEEISKLAEYHKSMPLGLQETLNKLDEKLLEISQINENINETVSNSIAASEKAIIQSFEKVSDTTSQSLLNILSELTKLFNGDFREMLRNLQDTLNNTESSIKSIDNNMYGLLEDNGNNLKEIKASIEEGYGEIKEAVSKSMEEQREIVNTEQSILNSYDELLGRINDEVIAKMISDSDTLLKCMKDCYNLLDSQRKAKR